MELDLRPWTVQVACAFGALTLLLGACEKKRGIRPAAEPDGKLPVVWEVKGHDSFAQLVSEGERPSVYRLDAEGALVRRDARTGKVIWRRPAPHGLRWTRFRVGRSHVALNGSPRAQGASTKPGVIAAGVIAALAIADGRVLWKKDHRGRGSLGVGAAGGGMFLEGGGVGPTGSEKRPGSEQRPAVKSGLAPCDVIAVHPASGAEISRRFHGAKFFRRGPGIKRRPACRRTARVLDRRGGSTIIAHYLGRPTGTRATGLRLSAWTSAKRSVWFKNLGVGPLWRVAMEPQLGIVSVSIRRTLLLLRIDPTTGKVTWRQSVKGPKSCPYNAIHIRAVPGPAKRLAVLAQRCDKVILIDAKTGKVHWERVTDVVAAVIGERPHGWPPPLMRFNPGWQSTWYRAVSWFTPDGQPQGRTQIPNAAGELCLVPEGILVGVRDDKGTRVALIDHKEKLRWSRPPSWESWLVYPYAVVAGSVIRIATGRVIGTIYPGKVLGLVPKPLILVTNDRGHLRGLRVPPH